MKSPTNHLQIRIYYEDTDCGDVVYYANYLKYMERGRTELLRDMGFELADLHKQDTLFMVAEAQIKYHSPARHNDRLNVVTSIIDHSSVTTTFHHEIANQKGVLCVSGDVKVACVDRKGKMKRIPKEIVEKLGD